MVVDFDIDGDGKVTEQEVANAQQEVLNKAPLKIYIG